MDNNKTNGKYPRHLSMPNGTEKVVEFNDKEYEIADLLSAGKSTWDISNSLGVSAYFISNLLAKRDFVDLVETKKYYRGKHAALDAEYVGAHIYDNLKNGTEPSPGRLSLIKMAMVATGMTKQGREGGKGKASMGFKIIQNPDGEKSPGIPADVDNTGNLGNTGDEQ